MLSLNPVTVGLESPIFQAAGKITRLLEDLLISGTLYTAPSTMFVINPPTTYLNRVNENYRLPTICASSLVCIMNIRKKSQNIRVVAEHRAHLTVQILHRFQDTWPIAIWTRHLLDSLLKILLIRLVSVLIPTDIYFSPHCLKQPSLIKSPIGRILHGHHPILPIWVS